jgi:hypothetical protein
MFIATTLPPGLYTVTVRATGFRTAVVENVTVEVGRTYSVEITCEVGPVEETVTVEAGAELIDVIKSESALVLKDLTYAAGGRDFQGFSQFMPSVNIESNYAFTGGGLHKGRDNVQIMVDGSSGAENVFYVDGIDTTNMYTGLANQNIRVETLQEFQLKTAGYEAEWGGAMGGVISVVTKSGGNDLHGSLFYYYGGSTLTAEPRERLRLNPLNADEAEYFQDPEDSTNRSEFGLTVGGPIVRNKAWFYGAYMPEFWNTTREVTFTSGESGIFKRNRLLRSATAKLDFQPWERVKLAASYLSDHYRWKGGLPSYDGTDNPAFDWARQGFEWPSYSVTGSATITASPKFIIAARWGLNVLDKRQFLGPPGVRHFFYPESIEQIGIDANHPDYAGLFEPYQWAEYGYDDGYATLQDFQKKSTYKFDASWLASAGGQHNIKFGYQFNRLSHAVNDAYVYDYIRFHWGDSYTMIDGTVRTSSCTITDALQSDGTRATQTFDPCGYYQVRSPFGVLANIPTDRHALYFQDGWTIGGRLTLNLGMRFEKEEIPSFSDIPEFAGAAFSWGFGDKIAPRLGFAYDLLGNHKVKIHANWGWFYDAMKLEMANGSFGGFKWISTYYLFDDANFDQWRSFGGISGTGFYPGTRLEARNWRIPSFDDLDPDIKPMRMSEFVGGFEWEVAPDYVFSFRFTHKQVDEAIEDVGRQTPAGEAYYITNPGRGFSVSKFVEAGLPPTPDPDRTYNAWEFRLRKAFSNRWRGDISYTYSRLRGLYSGLGSTDEGGRLSPNVDRDFDLWFLNYDSHGKLLSGPLNTDRPHQVKFNGNYDFPFNLEVGAFFRVMSGIPISRWTEMENVEIMVDNRGSDGRNPTWTQTDLHLAQKFYPFTDESRFIEFNFNVINLFNSKTGLRTFRNIYRDNLPLWTAGDDPNIVLGGYDVDAIAACFGLDASGNCIAADADPRFLQRDNFLPPIAARFGVKLVW